MLLFLTLAQGGSSLYGQIKLGDNIDQISEFALIELESSDKGFLISRMTSAQRDAVFNQDTPIGMMIYNTDANQLQYLRFEVDAAGKMTDHKIWEAATDDVAVMTGDTFPTSPTAGDLFMMREKICSMPGIPYKMNGCPWEEPTHYQEQFTQSYSNTAVHL